MLTRIYPNGSADVNYFHAAGGMGFLIGELLDAGLGDGKAKLQKLSMDPGRTPPCVLPRHPSD